MEQFVDARGRLCPWPIVALFKAMMQVDPGGTVVILATDPTFEKDVRAWCSRTGHILTALETTGAEFRATVQRKRPG